MQGFLFECKTNVVLEMLLNGWKTHDPLEDKLHICLFQVWEAAFKKFFASIP